MKKLVFLVIAILTLSPAVTKAENTNQTGIVNITIYTQGQEGTFNFSASGDYQDTYWPSSFSITTQNNIGTKSFELPEGRYFYSLILENNWSIVGEHCYSNYGSSASYSYNKTDVYVGLPVNNSVSCVFSLEKASKIPILIVPGLLGTEMKEDNVLLWADLERMVNPLNEDSFMDPLAFDHALAPISNNVLVLDILKKKVKKINNSEITLFDYSDGLISEFTAQGYVENMDLFTFPYDWRYGVSGVMPDGKTVVDLLQEKIQNILTQTGASSVDVIAHSTGGLLVKKYIQEHPTDHTVGKAVFVGVPNTGAPKAIKVLLQGDNFGVTGLSDEEMKKIANNIPVAYDLAPSEKYYATKGSYIKIVKTNALGLPTSIEELDFSQSNYYVVENGGNVTAVNNTRALHTQMFDEFDMSNAGVEVFNIVGCKNPTLGKVIEHNDKNIFGQPATKFYTLEYTKGDGTVPLESATTLPVKPENKYYALDAEHGKMLSQKNIREQIVNLLSGSNLEVSDKAITQDMSKCKLNGKAISIYSPLNISVTDSFGNHAGLLEDGSVENAIPGVSLDVFGDHKFLFVPSDSDNSYAFELQGSGNGVFTLKLQDVVDEEVGPTQVFSNIPVTEQLKGSLEIGELLKLHLDTDGNGSIDEVLSPNSALSATQSRDLAAPVTVSFVTGSQGQDGYYRSSVSIKLNATDPVLAGHEEETSGLLETWYSLDNMPYKRYGDTGSGTSVTVDSEGAHALKFYSVDRAGNSEKQHTVTFTIDTTAPQATIGIPENGNKYFLGSTLLAAYSCFDSLAGIFSCAGSVPNGSLIPTSILGSKLFTVTAIDNAGNETMQTAGYTLYGFKSLFASISTDSKTFKKSSTIPVKFQVTDGSGNSWPNLQARLYIDPTATSNGGLAESKSSSNVENYFKYDNTSQQYQFNLSTAMPIFTPGTSHTLRIVIENDPVVHDLVGAIKIK